MPQSLANILVHAISSTKKRRPLISDDVRPGLHGYVAGVLKHLESPALIINSVADIDFVTPFQGLNLCGVKPQGVALGCPVVRRWRREDRPERLGSFLGDCSRGVAGTQSGPDYHVARRERGGCRPERPTHDSPAQSVAPPRETRVNNLSALKGRDNVRALGIHLINGLRWGEAPDEPLPFPAKGGSRGRSPHLSGISETGSRHSFTPGPMPGKAGRFVRPAFRRCIGCAVKSHPVCLQLLQPC